MKSGSKSPFSIITFVAADTSISIFVVVLNAYWLCEALAWCWKRHCLVDMIMPLLCGTDGLCHYGQLTPLGVVDPWPSLLMTCWLTVPSHYSDHYWRMINQVLWHSPESNIVGKHQFLTWAWKWRIYNYIGFYQGPLSQSKVGNFLL